MRTVPIVRAIALGLALVGLSVSCSGDGSPTVGGENPSISISLSNTSLSLEQGGAASAPAGLNSQASESLTVSLTRSGGFSGAVSLAVTGAPSGVVASAEPSSIPAGSTTSLLSIDAGETATPGTYTLVVQATGSGVTTVSANLSLTVTAAPVPAFSISAAPAALSLAQGADGTTTVSIARSGGFTGDVALAVTGLPTGMTASATPATTAGNSSTIAVTVGAGVTPGTYPLTVTGTATGLSNQTATVTVTVTEVVSGSYTLSMDPAALSIAQGGTLTSTIQINRAGGFAGDVAVAISGLPAGVTATFDPPISPIQVSQEKNEEESSGLDNPKQADSSVKEVESPSVGAATGPDGPGPEATTGNSVTLTLNVGVGVDPDDYPLTVTGTTSGLDPQTTTLALTVTAVIPESFSLALNPGALSIQQGASAGASLTITRVGGFAGDVALAVTGMPSGMTATANPANTAGDASTVTVTVGAGVAVATYSLVVTGSTGTLPDETAALSVSVTAGGGGGGMVSFSFCDETGLPIWVGYQDGNGAWMQASGVNNTYSFNLSSAKGGVAAVTDEGAGEFTTLVYFGTTVELTTIGGSLCQNPAGTSKTLNGSVSGLGPTDQSTISMGGAAESVFGAGPGLFSLQKVSDGPQDLVATRLELGGIGVLPVLKELIIRRNLNPVNGSTLPVLDFGSAEPFAPEPRNLTINNLGADLSSVSLSYRTANGGSASLFTDLSGSNVFPAIGAANQVAGDLHSLNVIAAAGAIGVDNQRTVNTFFKASADQTVTMGPIMGPVTVTTASAAPYARLRYQYTIQADYASLWTLNFSQSNASSIFMLVTAGHQGGGATLDYTIPDFTTAAGWNNSWGLAAGTETAWILGASGWTGAGGIFGSPLMDGATVFGAGRFGTITP